LRPLSQNHRAYLVLPAVVAFVSICAWLSQATMAFTGPGRDRVGLLPLSTSAFLIVAGAAAAVLVAASRGASLVPLWLLGLLLLPWLPMRVPDAFVLWTGPIGLLIWLGVATCMAADLWGRRAWTPRRPAWGAGLLALVLYAIAAWQVSPSVPGGDEPHYLVITQSLLLDGDLRIENNHLRGDYHSYYAGELKPDYQRRGRNGEIYSIHAPGLPALIAPAFAAGGYRAVVAMLVSVAALGSALAWHLAWRLTGRSDAAWFAWAAVSLSTTAIFHSFTIYPDGPGGVLVLCGVWALLRVEEERRAPDRVGLRPWLLHGAALAALPWLHTRFALLAAGLGAAVLVQLATTRSGFRKAVAFLSVPAISALCWLGFFVTIYGTPMPSAPYAGELGSAAYIADGIAGLFMDQRFGLLPYAPVLIAALAGFAVMVAPGVFRVTLHPGARRIAFALALVCVPYLLVVTTFRMWWGGWSAPARFLVPILPVFVLPTASAWVAIRHRSTRSTVCAALVFTLFAAAVLVFVNRGALAYNDRTAYSHWLEWLTRTADLARAVPAWGDRDPAFFRDIAVWCGAMLVAWLVLRAVEGSAWLRTRAAFATATAAVYATSAMFASTITWSLIGSAHAGELAGQLDLLRRIASGDRAIGVGLSPWRRLPSGGIATALRLQLTSPPPTESPIDSDAPLFVLPGVPAGRYRLVPHARGVVGVLSVGIGAEPFDARFGETTAVSQPILVQVPVDVRSLVVRGDAAAWRVMRGLSVEALALVPASARLSDEYARRAVRYHDATVYFLDDRSFPEPSAFWVGGGCSSAVVVRFDRMRSVASFFLRNAPVVNRVSIGVEHWQNEIELQPGEERRIVIPVDPRRDANLITVTTSSGFRPSAVDPSSQDHRFLGVWMQVVE
jgi:hypothetical protein